MRTAALVLFAAAAIQQAFAETFTVIVGKNATGGIATVFTPNQIRAKVGDIVNFEFHAKNHSVTQSSFAEPCTRQFNTVTRLPGVDSGFMPVAAGSNQIPVFQIQIKQDTSPIWMFCNQASHCNNGMVFAINPPTNGEKTFERWTQLLPQAQHPDPSLGQTADFTPPNAQNGNQEGANSFNPAATQSALFTNTGAANEALSTNAALNGIQSNLNLGPQVTGPVVASTLSPNTIVANMPTAVGSNSGAVKLTSSSVWMALGLGLIGAIVA